MGFHEIRFPERLSYGSRGGPGFATAVIETEAGHEQRIGRWDRPRRRYNAQYAIKSVEDMQDLLAFFVARKGALNGFRFKDWFDYASSEDSIGELTRAPNVLSSDQLIGTGDGSETEFQLVKRYTSGSETVVRSIQKPKAGTVRVEVDGVEISSPGDFVVDVTTGIVTISTPPPMGDEVKAGFEFDVPVRFSQEADKLLQASYDFFDGASLPDVPLVEILDPRPVPDDWWLGGASEWATSSAVNPVLIGMGRLQLVDVTVNGHALRLPDPTDFPLGGPYFYLVNVGAEAGEIQDEVGATALALASQASATVLLGPSGWVVLG